MTSDYASVLPFYVVLKQEKYYLIFLSYEVILKHASAIVRLMIDIIQQFWKHWTFIE